MGVFLPVKTVSALVNRWYTENSYTDSSIYPSESSETETEALIDEVREQIDYPLLTMFYMDDTPDCILELICDVLCSTSPGIKIGGETIPATKVQARFRRLKFEHVSYVLDSLEKTTTEIKNIRTYLLTALYNAPLTIGPYYSAAVRHDAAR